MDFRCNERFCRIAGQKRNKDNSTNGPPLFAYRTDSMMSYCCCVYTRQDTSYSILCLIFLKRGDCKDEEKEKTKTSSIQQPSMNKECKCEHYTFMLLPCQHHHHRVIWHSTKLQREILRQGLNGKEQQQKFIKKQISIFLE